MGLGTEQRHKGLDFEWQLHQKFYDTITNFLNPERGQIILQENLHGSVEKGKEFERMFPADSGLVVVGASAPISDITINGAKLTNEPIYYFWVSVAKARFLTENLANA